MREQQSGTAKMDNVRVLPPGWKWVTLGELMSTTTGIVDPAKHPDEVFKLYSIPAHDIGQPTLVKGALIGSSKLSVEKGDVLLSKIVPHIRRTWVVAEGDKNRQIASTEWIVFRTKLADPDFLRFMLRDNDFHKQLMDTTSGVGGSLTRARPSLVAKIKIPFPPISKQKRIAAILNEQLAAVDKARAAAEAQLEAAKALPAAYLREVFPRPGQELPAGWKWVKLGEICNVKGGKRLPKGQKYAENKTLHPYLRVVDFEDGTVNMSNLQYITDETFNSIAKYIIEQKDVFISIAGTIGQAGIVPNELAGANLTENAARLILNSDVDNSYVALFLRSPSGQRQIINRTNKVGQPKLALERIRGIEIPMPSFAAQREIAKQLKESMANASAVTNTILHRLTVIKSLPSAILRQAFNGEL